MAAVADNAVAKAVWEAARAGDATRLRALTEGRSPAPIHYQEVGYTALHNAAGKGHAECVKLLLERGADTRAKASGGYTALHDAARNGHAECLRLLIEAGANLNEKNNFGGTALHGAAFYGKAECVRLLISSGVDVNLKTNDDKTAFDLSSSEEVKKLLAALLPRDSQRSQNSAVSFPDGGTHEEVEKLKASLQVAYAEISSLESQLAASRKKNLEYEKMFHDNAQRTQKAQDLAAVLEQAGWKYQG